MTADWIWASSEELTAAYAREEASPVDVVQSLLRHIPARDEELGAISVLYRDKALESAAASERRWKRRTPQSPLDGVPVMLREDMATPAYPNEVDGIAPVAARLLEAGCIIMGKTAMAAHETLTAGVCRDGHIVRNPWQPQLSPGGASSGAAVACAAGYAPLHVAVDRMGSLRLPAAFCGVYGFKPTQGRVPVGDPATGMVAGPISRTVHDAAALMNILVRPDDRDFTALPAQSQEYRMRVDGLSPKSLTIGVLTDMGMGLPVDPAISAVVYQAAKALQMAGAEIEMLDGIISPEMFDALQLLLEMEAHADLLTMNQAQRNEVPRFVREWAEYRAADLQGPNLMAAFRTVMKMRAAINTAMMGYDYLLMPVCPVLPYAAEALSPSGKPQDGLPHLVFTAPWSMAENPAASIHWVQGAEAVPIAVQVIGHRFDDLGVLRLSRTLEIMRPDQPGWPCLPQDRA
ncbi:MAG: amidase family protein [Lautropia sp.]|nr:amidase family protein [Lautropia sp.]